MKKIRFNLKFFRGDGSFDSVRSLAELQDKFNLDDLYEYFVSGQLELWLRCHGENVVAEKVSDVNAEKDVHEQIVKLFDALGFDLDKSEKEAAIASYLFPLKFLKRRAELNKSIKNVDETVRRDVNEYNELLKFLVENKEDFAAVKAGVRDVLRHHSEQFKLDYMRFYEIMVRQCPLAIFAVLMNNDYRDCFLASSENRRARYLADLSCVGEGEDLSKPLQHIKERLSKFLHVSASSTSVTVWIDGEQVDGEGYLLKDWNVIKQISDYEKGRNAWQDEVDCSKKIMVLWNDGVEARPYHDNTNQYKPSELNGKFQIMKGLEYRVTSYTKGCLLYMEV